MKNKDIVFSKEMQLKIIDFFLRTSIPKMLNEKN